LRHGCRVRAPGDSLQLRGLRAKHGGDGGGSDFREANTQRWV